MCSSSITLRHFNHLNPTGSYAPPSSPHLTMQEEECNVSLSLAIGGVGDLPFIKNLDQTSFKEEKEEKRDGGGTRKKLRLSGEQLALLEDSFRAHSTLAPVRPETRACAEVALAAEASGSMVSEQESQDQTEADGGRLRVLEEVLREAGQREQKAEEGADGDAISSEARSAALRRAPQGSAAEDVFLVREDDER
ncbi:homeobox-leucine zipper protein HAT1 isoform X3 [Musa acuminata AAA Group]|uniref:homeobox-leucine zipper protein HAT1 isoform X3 n=1 Tax=Musa acuminata AAA Group TaxID=214697 RepID=UPI0031DA1DB5